jgi:hypothetical protein
MRIQTPKTFPQFTPQKIEKRKPAKANRPITFQKVVKDVPYFFDILFHRDHDGCSVIVTLII